MQLYKLTSMALSLNRVIDSGKFEHLSIAEVRQLIRDGGLKRLLLTTLGRYVDTSTFDENDWLELTHEWQGFENAMETRTKLGVENKALCLLLGYALQSIQRRHHVARAS